MALMLNALPRIPEPQNSPFIGFTKGTPEKEALIKELEKIRSRKEIPMLPLWINGPRLTAKQGQCLVPHDYRRLLASYSKAEEKDVMEAIDTVLAARSRWAQIPWPMRLNIFLEAARLLETKYLVPMVAAVMEDYSKNPFEAFIDVQELIDFLKFNCYYASRLYAQQPASNNDTLNILDYLPLEGFVFAVPPNNFIAINGNLCTAPLIMGNVVVAKPSSDVIYSFHQFLKILHEAQLPKDVLAVLYGDSGMIGNIILDHPMLNGVHFTGGTDTFHSIWEKIGRNIGKYNAYPRLVGETGGKDAIVVYDDADPQQSAVSIAVGAFGAQGRKCSATSRVYMTTDMLIRVYPHLLALMDKIRVGDVADFGNYMGAIINEREHHKITEFIERAKKYHKVVFKGGAITGKNGWFIAPHVIVTGDPHYETMQEEIFGPVLTVCVLTQEGFRSVLKLCDETSPYALTGAIHTADMLTFCEALQELRFAAGNMSDDRTTAAMVNQQPFSGGRKSGTNSKVGWWLNLLQWTSPRTICMRHAKTTFPPAYLEA